MKKVILFLMATLLISCSTSSIKGTYEKTIANAVQTDSRGTWVDLQFKAIELDELNKITVADSIRILNEEFDKKRGKQIAENEEDVKRFNKMLDTEKSSRNRNEKLAEFYQNSLNQAQHRIDSLKTTPSMEAVKYQGVDNSKVLAVVVRCKFSIVDPKSKTEVRETYDFVLSADGKEYFSKSRVK